MGFFTFPGQQEHRKFNYRPIYYDKDEEERRRVFRVFEQVVADEAVLHQLLALRLLHIAQAHALVGGGG